MADFRFLLLEPDEARRQYHEHLRPRLEKVRSKTNAPWFVEDVYTSLVEGRGNAGLFVSGETVVGIAVVEKITEPHTNKQGVFIWAAEADSVSGILPYMTETWQKLASVWECSYAEFESNREGWFKKPRGGWEPVRTVWQKRFD
ncbi:MAG: hypothetical protein ACRBBW_20565 [Cellvibrionaceae bacterium]